MKIDPVLSALVLHVLGSEEERAAAAEALRPVLEAVRERASAEAEQAATDERLNAETLRLARELLKDHPELGTEADVRVMVTRQAAANVAGRRG